MGPGVGDLVAYRWVAREASTLGGPEPPSRRSTRRVGGKVPALTAPSATGSVPVVGGSGKGAARRPLPPPRSPWGIGVAARRPLLLAPSTIPVPNPLPFPRGAGRSARGAARALGDLDEAVLVAKFRRALMLSTITASSSLDSIRWAPPGSAEGVSPGRLTPGIAGFRKAMLPSGELSVPAELSGAKVGGAP